MKAADAHRHCIGHCGSCRPMWAKQYSCRLRVLRHRLVSCKTDQASGSSGKPEARDVRAVPVRFITVSKANSAAAVAMTEEWISKCKRYSPVTEVVVRPNPKKAASVAAAVAAEGEKVRAALAPGDFVVLLDERGREVSSEGMARLIAAAGDRSASSLVFCIGGPHGHSPLVRARATDCIRLSAMVLNHQVAYVVLAEQVYRGWTILRGEPYHH
ncbi:hypothetical protein V8C86DRAFT_2907781 [Haematococcus lacustris]